jgi:hypothetical protein
MPAISLRPSDAQAGGFLDDADVTFAELRFVVWDYMGKAAPAVALRVSMEEADGTRHEQYYSAGDPAKYQPSMDGKTIEPLAGATGLNQNTNVIAFITSIVNAGFPEDKLGEDVSIFDGMYVHVNQVAQPKRPGLKKAADDKEKTYLLVTKILRLPWEAVAKAPAKGAPKAASSLRAVAPNNTPSAHATAAPTPSPAADPEALSDEAIQQKARETVLAILMEKGGSVDKSKLPIEAFRVLNNDKQRNAIVMVIYQEGFLQAAKDEGVFTYDGKTISLG